MADEWDAAFHAFTVKCIKVQRELLAIRRQHETEVVSLEEEVENKNAALDEAQRSLEGMLEKSVDRKDKIQALNAELSEVQTVLLQTQREHNKRAKKLETLRKSSEAVSTQASEDRLANEAKRNELKNQNKALAARQTELIGYRHEAYTTSQYKEQLAGEELEDLDLEELKELLLKAERAESLVAEQEADWVSKQLDYFDSEIQFALAEEDFERAAVLKKDRNALRESEGIPMSPTGKAGVEEEEIELDDDDL